MRWPDYPSVHEHLFILSMITMGLLHLLAPGPPPVRYPWYVSTSNRIRIEDDLSVADTDQYYLMAVAYERNYTHITHLHHGAHSADYRRNLEFLIRLEAARLKAAAPPAPEPEATSQLPYPNAFAAEIGFVPVKWSRLPPQHKVPHQLPAVRLKAVAPPASEPGAISQPQSPDMFAAEIGFVPANGHACRRNLEFLITPTLSVSRPSRPPRSRARSHSTTQIPRGVGPRDWLRSCKFNF